MRMAAGQGAEWGRYHSRLLVQVIQLLIYFYINLLYLVVHPCNSRIPAEPRKDGKTTNWARQRFD